jgi:hypothetical protein
MIFVTGGGANLNFKVVGGTTQPSAPAENTIWVNTSTAISEWVFSPSQPSNPANGMVWFTTDRSSSLAFNALKKNNVTVYPIATMQYVGGSWVRVNAKTYQNGAWEDWRVWLYTKGDLCSAVTGGWEGMRWHNYNTGKFTLNESSITIDAAAGTTNATGVMAITTNAVDVSNIKTMYLNVTDLTTSSNARYAEFGLLSTKAYGTMAASTALAGKGPGVYSLDVTGLSGKYYVAVYVFHSGGENISSYPLTFNEVWGVT